MERGHCPHSHALDILATGFCTHGKVEKPSVVHNKCWREGGNVSDVEVFGAGWRDGEVEGAQRVDQAAAQGFAAIKRACHWHSLNPPEGTRVVWPQFCDGMRFSSQSS